MRKFLVSLLASVGLLGLGVGVPAFAGPLGITKADPPRSVGEPAVSPPVAVPESLPVAERMVPVATPAAPESPASPVDGPPAAAPVAPAPPATVPALPAPSAPPAETAPPSPPAATMPPATPPPAIPPTARPPARDQVAFGVIGEGIYSANSSKAVERGLVVRTRSQATPLINVDANPWFSSFSFTNDVLLFVYAGTHPNSGYEVVVTEVRRVGDALIVDARVVKSSGAYLTVMTDPHAILGVSKASVDGVTSVRVRLEGKFYTDV